MKKKITLITSIVVAICILVGVGVNYKETGKIDKNEVGKAVNTIIDSIETYNMSNEEVKELPTTTIIEQTEEQEKATSEDQGTTETEGFEEQGEIAYNGDNEFPNVKVGNYAGLTYYSQIDSRWKNHLYTSTGNRSQTIGTSGCGPTSAAMVVTSIKGAIKPDTMGDLFVKHGYRSANNGTYFSAFRWVADTFNIGYTETYKLDDVVNLLRNNYYVIVSCGNGLFTTGGHFIVIVGIDGNTLKIYDPYLYAGKFNTSTRRGKVTVSGNTVYCSVSNFRAYANYTKFFAFKGNGSNQQNNSKPVVTNAYTRYVKVRTALNVRNNPNGAIIGSLKNGTAVSVTGTSGNWSRITSPVNGWVSSDYLYGTTSSISSGTSTKTITGYRTGSYKVTKVSKNSWLNVRTGAGQNYRAKRYYELTANARNQNARLGNRYCNGYKNGVVCTVNRVSGSWGLTVSGWINLVYCTKL